MEEKSEEEENVNCEVQCHESPILTNSPSSLDLSLSKSMQLVVSGLTVEHHHLSIVEIGVEFAYMRNCNSADFINKEKFHRFVLRKTKSSIPYEWDLLDETGRSIVEHIVEDEDWGPSREWGPYGWYRYLLPSDIAKADSFAAKGKSVQSSTTVPV